MFPSGVPDHELYLRGSDLEQLAIPDDKERQR